MALTASNKKLLTSSPYVLCTIDCSTLVAGASETITLPTTISGAWPSGVAPDRVSFTVTTPPTSNDPVFMSYTGNSTTNNTITVKFDTTSGGSLTGAVAKLELRALAQATGGITVPA